VKRFSILAAALTLSAFASGPAFARNPHCAGGIQYLTQWRNDKDKGNLDDYRRELMKSIQQLEMCAAEDPKDYEAFGYLGWSYAEADSAAAAGRAFAQAIDGLKLKGDKKALQLAENNRDSYWAIKFNDGIAKIKTAQELYAEYCKKPANAEEETQRAEAGKKYDEALVSLEKAVALKGGEARTLRNMATVHALRCEYKPAEQCVLEALKLTPDDADLKAMINQIRGNMAGNLIGEKKYDEAITFYSDLLKTDPNNADNLIGLGEALFERAQTKKDAAREPDFKAAGDAYGAAAKIRNDADLWFNSAIAYQNATAYDKAETAWRELLKIKPGDPKATVELSTVLSDLKRFDDAIKLLHPVVVAEPKNKDYHRQLGAIYTKAGNNQKGTEELMVFLTLQSGKAVGDAATEAKKAPAGSGAAKTLASAGTPEDVYQWTADNQKWETWFYWNKRVAYHFQGGVLQQKSDWSSADVKTASGAK
jgi:tetratricopeptide (TPR) repeat protein